MTDWKSVNDAAAVRDEIKAFLWQIKDHGTGIDTGGGMGSADLWVKLGGVEYFVTVKAPPSKGGPDDGGSIPSPVVPVLAT